MPPSSHSLIQIQKRVLVIDDNSAIRFLIRSLIESDEFTVCGEAGDDVEGIEKAKALTPELILLDLSMPRMNGAEAASILKKVLPHVPIILFTLHDDSFGKALAVAVRVDRVIPKPDGMTKLLDCMRDVWGSAAL